MPLHLLHQGTCYNESKLSQKPPSPHSARIGQGQVLQAYPEEAEKHYCKGFGLWAQRIYACVYNVYWAKPGAGLEEVVLLHILWQMQYVTLTVLNGTQKNFCAFFSCWKDLHPMLQQYSYHQLSPLICRNITLQLLVTGFTTADSLCISVCKTLALLGVRINVDFSSSQILFHFWYFIYLMLIDFVASSWLGCFGGRGETRLNIAKWPFYCNAATWYQTVSPCLHFRGLCQ